MGTRMTKDEAADWAVRLDRAPLSPEEQMSLENWLAAAPAHQGALVRARAVWASLSGTAVAGPVAAAAPGQSAAPGLESPRPGTRQGLRSFGGLRAAAAVLAGMAVLLLGYRLFTAHADLYETRVGEVKRVALEDGSAITLNSNSAATVRFEKNLRAVTLLRGEGLFEVAKNRSRPFVVSTDGVAVRAVGTAFVVRAQTGEVTVTVTEGVVEVSQPDEPPQRVSANQRAEVRPRRAVAVQVQDAAEVGRQLSWRDGILSFSGESLAEAVREVNRYSRRQVRVEDPALAGKPVIGIFRAGDVDAFAQSAAVALGARTETDGEVIRLLPTGQ